MNPIQGATDTRHHVKLQSAIEQVVWTKPIAAAGGTVGLEIFTHFVGNGAELKIEIMDKTGKSFGNFTDRIVGNRFWASVTVPEKARAELMATVKLPKHDLSMKSNPLIVVPLVQITNLKWGQKEARRGDIVTLTADFKGVPDGTEATIEIYEHDADGAHDFITTFTALVKNNKVETQWEYEYHEDTDEIPTEEEVQKYGNHYNSPEYFFRVSVGGISADSGLLEFKDWVGIKLTDADGKPKSGQQYLVRFPDGKEKSGSLDDNGYAREEHLPPGPVRISFPDSEAFQKAHEV